MSAEPVALVPLRQLRRWARGWGASTVPAAALAGLLAALEQPVWAAVAGGVAVVAFTLWLGCAWSLWSLSSTLEGLARGEALGSWSLRPASAERFHADAARRLRWFTAGLALGVLALGGALSTVALRDAGPWHGGTAVGLTLLAASLVGVAWPRAARLDPREADAGRVLVGPDCAVVGGSVMVWNGPGIRPSRAEVVAGGGPGTPLLRVHARQRLETAEADTTVDVPVEAEDLPRAEAAARALTAGFTRVGG